LQLNSASSSVTKHAPRLFEQELEEPMPKPMQNQH